jgi:hypothetical protein
MASSAPLAKTFLISRGLSIVAMVAIVGMTAHFVSQLVDSNIDPPREIVGTLAVVRPHFLPVAARQDKTRQIEQTLTKITTDLPRSPLHPPLAPPLLLLSLYHPPHPHRPRRPAPPGLHHHLRPPRPANQLPQLPRHPQRFGRQLCRVCVGVRHGSCVWQRW